MRAVPARGTGTGAVGGVTGRPVGTQAGLVAAGPPGPTGTGDGAVCPPPACRRGQESRVKIYTGVRIGIYQRHRVVLGKSILRTRLASSMP